MTSASENYVEIPGTPENEDYQAFLDGYTNQFQHREGPVLYGHVLAVSDKEVIVDIGRKSEGLVPASQFPLEEGKPVVKPGDVIEVMFDRAGPPVEGYILLSHEKAHRRQVWDRLERAAAEGAPVSGRVVSKIKGGLAVDIGIVAFLPNSQVETRLSYNPETYLGREIEVRILKLNQRRGNAVVSRRVLLENAIKARKSEALANIYEGAEVTGTIKNLTDYGAFVDLGGIDGLLHVSDLSYSPVTHPSEVVHVGEQVKIKVLKFDKQKERISLGLKQMRPDPWVNIEARYPQGSRVIGRVASVTDYGAFVELEPGVEGLIHISEMTWSRRMKHPGKVVKTGDQVESVVLEIKAKERRISLGIKQLEADPWTTVAERYSIGSVVEGRVRKLSDFGAFVEIEEGVDGLVHVSDMSWTMRVRHPSEMVRKGQTVQAVILNIDAPQRRLSLGMKQLQPDAWETFFRTHQVGDIVRGQVRRAVPFGVFVELLPGVEGLCHNSEITGERGKRRKPHRDPETPALPIGESFDFKIVKMNEAQRRIGLSYRALAEYEERFRLREYQRQAAAATSSRGTAIRQHESTERFR
ncbi:MAG: 30S ribosomal protein S1 [Acidobacteriaceae bacterium]|nr:30S ribosomal protein S1 [Acidobacteriaceae bacterium]MBV9781424.1 30S ribosomal protein S1 [Acidobacteriaceae bacterium]